MYNYDSLQVYHFILYQTFIKQSLFLLNLYAVDYIQRITAPHRNDS